MNSASRDQESPREEELSLVVSWLTNEAKRISALGEIKWTREGARDCGLIASAYYLAAEAMSRKEHRR